jgi:hypothetical protein
MLHAALVASLFALSLNSAQADAPKASPLPPPDPRAISMQSFGQQNATCEEWTNSCQVCRRAPDGQMGCSTPGIACQPAAIVCKATRRTP